MNIRDGESKTQKNQVSVLSIFTEDSKISFFRQGLCSSCLVGNEILEKLGSVQYGTPGAHANLPDIFVRSLSILQLFAQVASSPTN